MENQVLLSVTENGGAIKTVTLEKNKSLIVGSGPNCRLVLAGDNVNSMHCMIWLDEENDLRIKDWNTGGKTVLNGQPIESETTFSVGDKLEIGSHRIEPVLSEDADCDPCNAAGGLVETDKCHAASDSLERCEPDVEPDVEPESNSNAEPMDRQVSADENANEELSKEIATDEFKYDPYLADEDDEFVDADFDVQYFNKDDSADNGEVELLRMEVEQLRFELAERDAQFQPSENPDESFERTYQDNDETVRLVSRLEELLNELQTSDERVQALEELLRVSDQATQAEREERSHLESWVEEIEQRVAQREEESAAAMSRLENNLKEARTRSKLERVKFKEALAAQSKSTPDAQASLVKSFREQIEDLELRLEQSQEENESLRDRRASTSRESSQEFQSLQQKYLELEVSTSRERAEMARQQEQLERLKNELQQKLNEGSNEDNADSRIRAMRQHLHEIHEQELSEKKERSLSGRISRLLSRTGRH